jgi:hypothetical protein
VRLTSDGQETWRLPLMLRQILNLNKPSAQREASAGDDLSRNGPGGARFLAAEVCSYLPETSHVLRARCLAPLPLTNNQQLDPQGPLQNRSILSSLRGMANGKTRPRWATVSYRISP